MHIEISFLIFLLQVYSALCYRSDIIKNSLENKIDKCIIDILSSKTQFSSLLFVVNSKAISNDLLRQIHSLNNVNVCVKNYDVSMKMKPDIYLIYHEKHIDLKKIEKLIDNLDKDWYRQPEALYLVIVKYISEDEITAIFKILWEYHFIHVLLINDLSEDAPIYTYFPYAEGRCGRDYTNVIKFSDCKYVRNIDVIKKLREYDKPILNNCTLNVATRNYPPLIMCNPAPVHKNAIGIERFLVELFFMRLNVSLNYTCLPETEDVGSISDNFTVTGVMRKLYQNQVDLLFGGFSLNNRRVGFFDFICNHLPNEDTYVPATSSADLIERWKMVYIMFHTNVWLLLLLILFLCAVLLSDFRIVWIIRNEHDNALELFNLFGNATQNITLVLRERFFKNCVIVNWLWFVFLLNTFYQTGLTSLTTHRAYKPQVDNYLSLHEYNFTPCMPRDVVQFLKHSGKVPIIHERFLDQNNCQTADLALDEIARTNNKYTVTMYLQYLWWATKHHKEKRRVHLMKENLYNNLYAIFLKRGFPLLDKLNAKMLRLPEHGFVHGAKDFHCIPRELRSESYIFDQTALKLNDLTVPFGILITGLVSSLFVFILELVHKCKMNS